MWEVRGGLCRDDGDGGEGYLVQSGSRQILLHGGEHMRGREGLC